MASIVEAAEAKGKLGLSEVHARLESCPEWALEGLHLVKRLSFDDFAGALAYTNKLGALAEAEGHHPDLMLGWGYVEIRITTHDLGGLTERDFGLAAKIDGMK